MLLWVLLIMGILSVLFTFPGLALGVGAGDPNAPAPLTLQPFSEQECQKIADRVRFLRVPCSENLFTWQKRNPIMWTLGTASYLDAVKSEQFYDQKASRTNALLIEHFDWVYQRLLQMLRDHWAPRQVDYLKSLPGFHIFRCDSVLMCWPLASVHLDQQEQLLSWDGIPDETISFTVPIELPISGGGLWMWDDDVSHPIQLLGKKKTFLPYEPGRMVLHTGKQFHLIAPVAKTAPNTFRISLQGHAVRIKDHWWVYW